MEDQAVHPLRAYRAQHDLTCAKLAKTLGIAEPTLRSFENGHRKISAETAIEIERKIGISRSELRSDIFERAA